MADVKSAPSKSCEWCGEPTHTLAVRCLSCLGKVFLTEELIYTRTWLAEHPEMKITLAHDKGRLLHLALFRPAVRNLGWCGAKLTQMQAKRVKVAPRAGEVFPPELCLVCHATYKGMKL